MAKIAYVTNAPPQAGMGKPARAILQELRGGHEFDVDFFSLDAPAGKLFHNNDLHAVAKPFPGPLGVKPIQWWRLARQLPAKGYDLWHLTNQTLSFIPRTPFVVTVYDLIELLDPQERFGRAVARFLYRGIPKARHVICISQHTKRTVQDAYGIPDDRVTVIPLGVGKAFSPIEHARESLASREFFQKQRIPQGAKIILYVGSDHPRKNLGVLARAFAEVRRELKNVVLVKVGDAGLTEGRERFLRDLDALGVRDAVRFIPNVDDKQLRFFYSLADVFVFPSTFEGFGIPPLEAMACGCPVVSSNATSLPEVVGDAGILCNPRDVPAFVKGIGTILRQSNVALALRQKGIARAGEFHWDAIAEKTSGVYRRILNV